MMFYLLKIHFRIYFLNKKYFELKFNFNSFIHKKVYI